MRNIKAAFITILFAFAVMFSCFSGCGEEIYDLAKMANEGIPIASVLIYDSTSYSAVITDGDEYLKVIPLTGYSESGYYDMTVDTRGNFHVCNNTTIYTYKRDGSYSVSSAFNYVYGIAAGNDSVYALVANPAQTYFIYRYNSDTGQWTDTGIDISAFNGNVLVNRCLIRDNATGNVYFARWDLSVTSTFYRVPNMEVMGTLPSDGSGSDCYAVYNNEGFSMNATPALYSTLRGTLATGILEFPFSVMDSDNIFFGEEGSTIYRYNTIKGLTSKNVYLPHSTGARIVPLDGSRIIVGEFNSTTCDILLYNYDTDAIERTIYSYPNLGAYGALYLRVYR
ncbi:MAG TPA: hypothetical protein PLI62_16220 [Spirochaetota bacterium]|nr:hypothetical protein [Spirochaetota bacterium]HQP50344.1 hypothetical protein [Spirochaetota bacterium]